MASPSRAVSSTDLAAPADYDACLLALTHERLRSERLAAQVDELRRRTESIAVKSESEEEGIMNRLLRRAESLAKEKARILADVEREEEFLTNTLQRKLSQLQREKIDIQNQLEVRQATGFVYLLFLVIV
jgi:hypothetical protein